MMMMHLPNRVAEWRGYLTADSEFPATPCSPTSSDDDDHIRDGLTTKTLGEEYSSHDGPSIVDTKLTSDSCWY